MVDEIVQKQGIWFVYPHFLYPYVKVKVTYHSYKDELCKDRTESKDVILCPIFPTGCVGNFKVKTLVTE